MGVTPFDQNSYDQYAKEMAELYSTAFSKQAGTKLRFNGYARGPNIFLETADAATTRWAAIDNPYSTVWRANYALIRRSCYGPYDLETKTYPDPQPNFEIWGFEIPKKIANPMQPSLLQAPATGLGVSPAAIEELTANGELWVGGSLWDVTPASKNVDDFSEYQRDYKWVASPLVQRNYPLVAQIANATPKATRAQKKPNPPS